MDPLGLEDTCKGTDSENLFTGSKDTTVQLVLAVALGSLSFFVFCLLRPRWRSLYAARKQQKDPTNKLPQLPDTFLGWIPALWRVTEQQVLASAGLDAFVFLTFFKLAIKFLIAALLLSTVIITPINYHFVGLPPPFPRDRNRKHKPIDNGTIYDATKNDGSKRNDVSYLWSYMVFTYVFTAILVYLLFTETRKVIHVRQDYLGSQTTITDRTIKLSGIPVQLRSEQQIKTIVEKLAIGSVENVTLCRNWKNLDSLIDQRAITLRRLEEASNILGRALPEPYTAQAARGIDADVVDSTENERLLPDTDVDPREPGRPTTKIWYGFLNWQSKKIDAIDYYQEKLRTLEDEIVEARKHEFIPSSIAFVTMDSVPACQMAVQALIDPTPMQFLAHAAPCPADIVWRNTYLPRSRRMVLSWTISIFVGILTIVWLIPVASMASLLNLCTIKAVWPQLADLLYRHEIGRALVQTGLPTLIVSLLNVAVPYLYDWLSNKQGFISQSEVELSVISKNFAFTFFNFFLVFTVFGAATNIWSMLQESARDTTAVARAMAAALDKLGVFYTNFILLQGIGLFPLRLLEFGSICMYPITRMGAKTPRDFAELVQPPVFSYGFYLPTSILIFILCLIYSILPAGFMVLFFGALYFVLGYFTYKYQLLYAMDHPQHATGRAWSMIVYRILLGLGIFQLAMSGVIATGNQYWPAIMVVPLIPFTVWLSYYYSAIYEPLTVFIALRSIRRDDDTEVNIADQDTGINLPSGHMRRNSTIDEDREKGQRFINPSLIIPLNQICTDIRSSDERGRSPPALTAQESTSSAYSYGDSHVWRDNNDGGV